MSKKDTSCNFSVRVTANKEDVETIEIWTHELAPIDRVKSRSSEDWIYEHLSEIWNRERFAELIPAEQRDGCFQLLAKGKIDGSFDYWGEYDEDLDLDEIKSQALPDDWFDEEKLIPLGS